MKTATRITLAGFSLLFFIFGFAFADRGTPSGTGFTWADSQDVSFNWIEVSDGTALGTAGDDDVNYSVALGFNFSYYQSTFTSVNVSSNGFLTFHSYPGNSFPANDGLTVGSSPDSLIAAFWDDLIIPVGKGANIYSKVVGSAPFRKMVIEFKNVELKAVSGPLTFEVILYETLNIIKIQYLKLGTLTAAEQGSGASVGLRYQDGVGISDNLIYSVNAPNLYDNMAILFYGSGTLSSTASISPASVTAGTSLQSLTYKLTGLSTTATTHSALGKADIVRIKNPINTATTDPLIVTGIRVDGQNYFILNSTTTPSDAGFATWSYNNTTDSLIVRLPAFSVKDSISVTFAEDIPATPSTPAFASDIYPKLSASSTASSSASLTINSGSLKFVIIQKTSADGGAQLADTSLTAGAAMTLYAAGYDANMNFLGLVNSAWTISPGKIGKFANSSSSTTGTTVTFTADTVGSGTVSVAVVSDPTVTDVSGIVTVSAGAANYILIRDQANGGGSRADTQTFTITTDSSITLYAAHYDARGNFIGDMPVGWSVTGTLPAAATGLRSSLLYAPASTGTGTIRTTSASVTNDTTGAITVNSGSLKFVIIQKTSADGGAQLADTALTAGATMTLYAAGYDANMNFLGLVNSAWTISPGKIGKFANSSSSTTGTTVTFTADTVGSGTVSVAVVSDPTVTDVSGIVTVSAGAANYILIRDQANGGGSRADTQTFTITTDSSITLYAAHYDARGNFIGDMPVGWSVTGTLPAAATGLRSSLLYAPTSAGTGTIRTTSASVTNDTTGQVTVNVGALDHVVIQDVSGTGGSEITTLTMAAGATQTLVLSGYDRHNNYISDFSANWSVTPSTAGTLLTANPTASNIFRAEQAGTAIVNATLVSGALSDQTSLITINAGTAATLAKVAGVDSQATPAGSALPKDIKVQVKDSFGNAISGVAVGWNAPGGGSVNPVSSTTDAQGIASTIWTVHNNTSKDSLKATVTGITTVPDTVTFYAFPTTTSASAMQLTSAAADSGAVNSAMTPFIVQVLDSLNNPVSGFKVNFAITQIPSGASGQALSADSAFTNSSGLAQTVLTLGNKLGSYRVSAFAATNPARIDFTGKANTPAVPSSIISAAGGGQTGTVGQALPVAAKFQLLDAFANPVSGQTLTFEPLGGGSVSPGTAVTDANGFASTTWTLGTAAGSYQLRARNNTGSIISDTLTATATAGNPGQISVFSIRGISSDSVTTLPTFSTPFKVKVVDANGNPVANTTVNFSIQSGAGAVLAESSALTDASGIASNAVNIDPNQSLTVVSATVTGAGSALVHLYRLTYTSASLTPASSNPGSTESFQIQATNPGPYPVRLQAAASSFNFTDGSHSFQAALSAPDSIPANVTGYALNFVSTTISNLMANGGYTPEIVLQGRGVDAGFQGSLFTDTQELKIFSLEILSVSAIPTTAIRGLAFAASMSLRNNGNVTINIDSLNTKVVMKSGTQIQAVPVVRTSGSATIGPAQVLTMDFSLTPPSNMPEGLYTLDGIFAGTVQGTGQAVTDSSAASTDQITIISGASLSYSAGTLTPTQVTAGQSAAFSLDILNSGQADVVPDLATTFFTFGTDTFFLASGQVLNSGMTTTLQFSSKNIVSAVSPVAYVPVLSVNGTENGAAFSQSVPISDSVLVQNAPGVTYSTMSFSVSQAGQGQGNLPLTLVVANQGSNVAPAVISAPGDIAIRGNGILTATPLTPASGSYPITLTGGQSQTFTYDVALDSSYPTGNQTFWAKTTYSDGNSGQQQTFTDSLVTVAQIQVLQKAALQITQVILPNDTVQTGQTVDTVKIMVNNPGGVAALIQNVTITPRTGLYTITALNNVSRVPAGGNAELDYRLVVSQNSSAVLDTLDIAVSGQDSLSAAAVNATGFFSWLVQRSSQLAVSSVTPIQSLVSRGQTGINVKIVLSNPGGVKVRLDTVRLNFANGSNNYQNFVLGGLAKTINAGDTAQINFSINVLPTATLGTDVITASAVGVTLPANLPVSTAANGISGSWSVQQRPVLQFTSFAIDKSIASTGQQGLLLSFPLKNNGGVPPTASAMVDSVHLLVNGVENDSTNLQLSSLISFPFTLGNSASFPMSYQIGVRTTALSGAYVLTAKVFYRDVNDDSVFQFTDPASQAGLTVQQIANFQIGSIQIVPDTAAVGQSNVQVTVQINNTGESSGQILSNSLLFSTAFPFTQTLQTPTLPVSVAGGAFQSLVYSVNVPSSISLAQMADTVNFVGASFQSKDDPSGSTASVQVDSVSSLTVVNPAHFQFFSLGPQTTFNSGDTSAFTVTVINTGGSIFHINNGTVLEIPSNPVITASVDLATSPAKIMPGDTAIIKFDPVIMSQTGEFVPTLKLRGSTNTIAYSQDITTQVVNIGGQVSITLVQATPSDVRPGETNVDVIARVTNQGLPLKIDTVGTSLDLRYVDNGEILNVIPRRIDLLDSLPKTGPGSFATLEWQVDIPANARLGKVTVNALMSFNNGTLAKTSLAPDTLLIKSDVILGYKPNSLSPNAVVPGESVAFSLTVNDSGNTDLVLNPDSTYLEFTDGTNTFRSFISGNFTIRGTTTGTPRENSLTFLAATVPANFLFNAGYPVTLVFHGQFPNGQKFKGDTLTAPAAVTVLREATVRVDSIDVVPANVTLGQTFITVNYYLSNIGSSAARINSLNSVFKNAEGTDVSSSWINVFNSSGFPFQIAGNGSTVFTRQFNLLSSATPELNFATLTGSYNDVLKPTDFKNLSSAPVRDSVQILQSSSFFVKSLSLVGIPNPPKVNYGQSVSLSLVIQNVGDDTLKNVYVRILKDEANFVSNVIGVIPPNSLFTRNFSFLADSVSGSQLYRAIIDSAFSETTGEKINAAQPEDNTEQLVIQQPRTLFLAASASDSSLSTNQSFDLSYNINTTGESAISGGSVRIVLPPNYQLNSTTPNPVQTIDPATLSGFWSVKTTSVTAAGSTDSILVRFENKPADVNTGNSVGIGKDSSYVPVVTDSSAGISTRLTIFGPIGARDSVLSTGQTVTFQDDIEFLGAISNIGKTSEIIVPAGYSVQGATSKSLDGPGTIVSVQWTVNVPSQTAANDPIIVKTSGVDQNTNLNVSVTDTLYIRVVNQARMNLDARIFEPPGARDGIISSFQLFKVSVSVSNSGQAAAPGTNQVRLVLPSGFRYADLPPDSLGRTLAVNTGDSTVVSIFAPTNAVSDSKITGTILVAAADENNNQPAAVNTGVTHVNVVVVNRAALQVDNLTVSQDSLTQNQAFTVTGRVQNVGDADVLPGDSVWVTLNFDSQNLQLSGGETARKAVRLINKTANVNWQMKSAANANPGSYNLIAALDDTASADENNYADSTVFLQKGSDTTQVRILGAAQLAVQYLRFERNQNDSLVVSTDQTGIGLSAKLSISSLYVSTTTATLVFPAGSSFSADTSTTKPVKPDSSVRWRLQAPPQTSGWTPLKVKFQAVSPVNPDIILRDSATVFVRVVKKANLVLNGQISAPAGAIDDTVSYGQTFTYQAVVTNTGQANLLSPPDGPAGRVEIQLDPLLKLASGSNALQTFTPGNPVQWQIVVDSSSTQTSAVLNQIDRLNRQLSGANAGLNDNALSGNAEAINAQLRRLYQQLAEIIDSTSVNIRIRDLPFDENTRDSSFVSRRSVSTKVFIEDQPFIKVAGYRFPQVWSTDQTDTIDVLVDAPPSVGQRTAKLRLPPGFINADSVISFSGTLARWVVRSPATVNTTTTIPVHVELSGLDLNSASDLVSSSGDTSFVLEEQARLKMEGGITAPASSRGGRVSKLQNFTISVTVLNQGSAPISGIGRLKIDTGDFSLNVGEDAIKSFTSLPASFDWDLVAPDSNLTSLVRVSFLDVPMDANKGKTASLILDSSQVVVSVSVVSKRLFIERLSGVAPNANNIQGAKNVPALGLAFSNPESDPTNKFFISKFFVSIRDPNSRNSLQEIGSLISRIRVVDLDTFNPDQGTSATEYANVAITDTASNPLSVGFSMVDTVGAGETDNLLILLDISDNAPNRSFLLGLERVVAFQVTGNDTFFVDVTDSVGNPVDSLNTSFQSTPVSVVSSDPQKAFGNYPNPFGLQDGITRFVFFMEQPGEVSLRVYSLLGELVYSEDKKNLPRGLMDGKITWDGHNDQGNLVLNGVYIGILKIRYNSGSSFTFKTKIAFIK